jgi:hypothetical protein
MSVNEKKLLEVVLGSRKHREMSQVLDDPKGDLLTSLIFPTSPSIVCTYE